MFNCPHCRRPLAHMKGKGSNFWKCENCGGHAVGLALLRQTAQPRVLNQLWQTAQKPGRPAGFGCPSCLRPMKAVPLEAVGNAFEVDVCQLCQFFWFDGNELQYVPKAPKAPAEPEKQLPQAAREALALAKVEQIAREARKSEDGIGDLPEEPWKIFAGFLGMPVEEGELEIRRTPIVTWTIAAAILAFSLIIFMEGRAALEYFAFIPDQPWRLGGLTWITSFFTHAGFTHVLGNLYFLLIFGDNVEDLIGRKHFLLVLLLSALLGDALHWMIDPRSAIPTVGASGGISGIIALYALAFPHARLGMLFRFGFYFRWIPFTAAWGFLLWLLLQVITAALQASGHSNVSGLAHLGGALVGVAYWFLAARPGRVQPA